MKLHSQQILDETKNIQKAIEKHKADIKPEHFTSVSPEEIERKLRRN